LRIEESKDRFFCILRLALFCSPKKSNQVQIDVHSLTQRAKQRFAFPSSQKSKKSYTLYFLQKEQFRFFQKELKEQSALTFLE